MQNNLKMQTKQNIHDHIWLLCWRLCFVQLLCKVSDILIFMYSYDTDVFYAILRHIEYFILNEYLISIVLRNCRMH